MTTVADNSVKENIPARTMPLPDGSLRVFLDDGIEENYNDLIDLDKEALKTPLDVEDILLQSRKFRRLESKIRQLEEGSLKQLLLQLLEDPNGPIHHNSGQNGASSQTPPASSPRRATINRQTAETKITLSLNLDGTGQGEIATGIGFFDHMLTLLTRHSLIDLTVKAEGDLHVDGHHTVEDVGICYGKALSQALGDKAGIRRYGDATVPMDETLVTSALDLSGRPWCVWKAIVPNEMLGTFSAPLAEEFWRAVASSAGLALHVVCHHGSNTHHVIEGIFKATARALRQAVEADPRMIGVPSTKGVL